MTQQQPAEIECTECAGMGCDLCRQGWIEISQCPQKFIGQQLIDDINIAETCQSGVFPVSGGLLDQPAYFVELSHRIKSETNKIEREQIERERKRV